MGLLYNIIMNTLDIISLPFFEFTADEQLTDSVLDDVKTLNFDITTEGGQSVSFGEEFYYHPKLFDFFDECLLEVKNKLRLHSSLELPIVSCWANKNSRGQYHHYHNHPNSVVSGIFYLTTHEKSETVFVFPDPWYKNIGTDGLIFCTSNSGNSFGETLPQLTGKNKPVKGQLLIFPSHIKHKVLPVIENTTRYTLSFNTFISGIMGNDYEHSMYLNLKVKSVREIKEQK